MAMDRVLSRAHTLTEKLASSILGREGVAAIWQLNEVAAEAHRTGHPLAAASLVEIADAGQRTPGSGPKACGSSRF